MKLIEIVRASRDPNNYGPSLEIWWPERDPTATLMVRTGGLKSVFSNHVSDVKVFLAIGLSEYMFRDRKSPFKKANLTVALDLVPNTARTIRSIALRRLLHPLHSYRRHECPS